MGPYISGYTYTSVILQLKGTLLPSLKTPESPSERRLIQQGLVAPQPPMCDPESLAK